MAGVAGESGGGPPPDPVRKRRAPVAAPGAKRLTLTGVMGVPDEYGRIRVLLVDRLACAQRKDLSWRTLLDEVPGGKAFSVPYELHGADSEGVRGEFWAVAPARLRRHWLEQAAALRGQEVCLEVTVRNYTTAATAERAASYGASLDISMLEPVSSANAVRGEIAQ